MTFGALSDVPEGTAPMPLLFPVPLTDLRHAVNYSRCLLLADFI